MNELFIEFVLVNVPAAEDRLHAWRAYKLLTALGCTVTLPATLLGGFPEIVAPDPDKFSAKPGEPGYHTGQPPAPGSIRDKILAFLKDHPKSNMPTIKEAIGATASGGGFAAALKVGVDKGQIVCHEPNTPLVNETPYKLYSLAP